jgi:hypothetical protein
LVQGRRATRCRDGLLLLTRVPCLDSAKDHAIAQGGTIGHEYSLIKGFSVSFPEDAISTLESHEHVKAVEKDGVMKTQ